MLSFIHLTLSHSTRSAAPQMRAANQQDLIYKRGQAGITKASVTIVFDNSDRANSPVGFEDYKQITVTRQVRCVAWYISRTFFDLMKSNTDCTPKRVEIPTQWTQGPPSKRPNPVPVSSTEHQ